MLLKSCISFEGVDRNIPKTNLSMLYATKTLCDTIFSYYNTDGVSKCNISLATYMQISERDNDNQQYVEYTVHMYVGRSLGQ